MNTDSVAGSLHPVSDRGRRLSDAVREALAAGGVGRWVASRLSDGRTDGNIYDRRADAVAHQLVETQCAYVMVHPLGMPPHEASAFLEVCERIYDSGRKLSDPENTPMLGGAVPADTNRAIRRSMMRTRRRNGSTR